MAKRPQEEQADNPKPHIPKTAVFIMAFAALLPVYMVNVEQKDAVSLCLSFSCFALFAAALLRALLYPRPFAGEDVEDEDTRCFRRVCAGSLSWSVGLWLLMALCIACFRHPGLPFWDALYADLSVNLDTRHYLNIAENGYVPEVNIDSQYIIVFFPLFPWLLRLLSPGGSYFITACLLNILLAALSGPVLYRLARLDFSPRASVRAVRYLYIFPSALFLVTPMTESLFLLLCLLYILCLRKGKWVWLLPLGLLASLCRLQGVLLASAAAVEYLLRLSALLRQDGAPLAPLRRLKRCLCLAGEALYAVTGLFGGAGIYLGINHFYYGDAFHFLSAQKSHWMQSLGFFFNTPAYMAESMQNWFPARFHVILGTSLPGLLTIFGVLVLLLAAGRRIRLSYLVYALTYYAVTIGATWLLSAPRYMAVLFSLPLAAATLPGDEGRHRFLSALSFSLFFLYFVFFVVKLPIY